MKNITKIARRLMLVFMAFVASSMMFLSSPALAATVTTLNYENFGTEVEQSSKPVVIILASEYTLKESPSLLEETKAKAEKFYGDKYKIVVGKIEENDRIYRYVIAPPLFPPPPGVLGFKNGEPIPGLFFTPTSDPTPVFERLKEQLG